MDIVNLSKEYKGKTVFVTGHTGFKGSWLCAWLQKMGATVVGYSLSPLTTPSHIEVLDLDMTHIHADIRDLHLLEESIKKHKPDIIFHMAAQSLVKESYQDPVETYETNVIGTLKVFEAARKNSAKAIVNVTSDKCYENVEQEKGYIESDPMGGYDPYSSSKGCAEILTASYRRSYFNNETFGKSHNTLLGSGRAGNVLGGGDWASNRLLPDIMRAVAAGEKVTIRSPHATRPWQHVLEPLRGYLMLGVKLFKGETKFADGWNFGPFDGNCIPVGQVLEKMQGIWNDIEFDIEENNVHEARFLHLNSHKAQSELQWKPVLDIDQTLKMTSEWYREFYKNKRVITNQQIDWYMDHV